MKATSGMSPSGISSVAMTMMDLPWNTTVQLGVQEWSNTEARRYTPVPNGSGHEYLKNSSRMRKKTVEPLICLISLLGLILIHSD